MTSKTNTTIKRSLLQIDIAFVIDNTGSMSSEIDEAQRRLADIVKRIAEHRLNPMPRFAVIGYRDHPPQDVTFTSKVFCDLDSDLTRCQSALSAMAALGGGDGPEAVVDGLYDALNLSWNRIAQKVILLVGDAPPHGEGADGDGFASGCPCGLTVSHLAAEMNSRGITAHAVGVRTDTHMMRSFTAFATATGGVFVHLNRAVELTDIIMNGILKEIEKIDAEIRTIEKHERGETLTTDDHKHVESLEKKGVRVIEMPRVAILGTSKKRKSVRILEETKAKADSDDRKSRGSSRIRILR